jgi:hypothetical protein
MAINWDEVQKNLYPIKNYEELSKRLRESFSYSFICDTYNRKLPELIDYTHRLLGGDSRQRYAEYDAKITQTLACLAQSGCGNVANLIENTCAPKKLEIFVNQVKLPVGDVISVLKYLVYWFIPGEKYLSGLIQNDATMSQAIKRLGENGIRTNLQLLQSGITKEGRNSLARMTRLPLNVIAGLVNRADFSRIPWASKATISNIIGAGYPSIAQLANANPEQLYANFFKYGESIGKNLKLGNEIENSFRIAKIIPAIQK